MEIFSESQSVTSNIDMELRRIFGLQQHEVNDVSISNQPKREAYFDLQEARSIALNEEDIIPRSIQALRDTAIVLSSVVSDVINTPAIFPLPGGAIGLQWNGESNTIFTASLYGDGLIIFSRILSDSNRLTGTCEVSKLRRSFIESLRETLEN